VKKEEEREDEREGGERGRGEERRERTRREREMEERRKRKERRERRTRREERGERGGLTAKPKINAVERGERGQSKPRGGGTDLRLGCSEKVLLRDMDAVIVVQHVRGLKLGIHLMVGFIKRNKRKKPASVSVWI
jgi:hypothetical protein